MRKAFRILLITICTVIGVFTAYVAWDELYRHISLFNRGEYYNTELYNPINLEFLIPITIMAFSIPSVLFHLRMYAHFFSIQNDHLNTLDLPELPAYLHFSSSKFRLLFISNLIFGIGVLGFGLFVLILWWIRYTEGVEMGEVGIVITILDLLFGVLILFDAFKNRTNFLKKGL